MNSGKLVRVAIAGVTAGMPVLGMAAPPALVRIEPFGTDPRVRLDATAGGGRMLARCLRDGRAAEIAALLDPEVPEDATLLLLPRDESTGQLDLLADLRTLARRAAVTLDGDRFAAEVIRGDRHTRARAVLAAMHGTGATAERRRQVHARLRRLRVPRPAEVAGLLTVRVEDPAVLAAAVQRADQVLAGWPRAVDLATPAQAATPAGPGRVIAVPGRGNPAEERTRRGLVDRLSQLLADRTTARRVALVAGSGMGKTSLAVRMCGHLADGYTVVGWLSATNSTTWRSSVALLTERLGVDGAGPDDLWQALGERRPALIVVDDAPEPAAFAASLPSIPGVHVLVTSPSVRWRAEAATVELEPLSEPDGIEFLLARTGAEDERLAAEVTRRLGGFPLALEQAAAAVVDGLSLRGWLDRHGDAPATGAAALDQAWRIRLAALRDGHPDALALLRILSCAQPAPVSGELLTGLGRDYGDDPAVAVCADTGRRDAAVAELRAQALIRTGADEETLLVHPLLAGAVRDEAGPEAARVALMVAAVAGRLLGDEDVNDADLWSRVMALSAVAVAACHLVLDGSRQRPGSVAPDRLRALANHALWLPRAYLHERGAARDAYRVALLALAMHGDEVAAAAVPGVSAEVIDAFDDLDPALVLPAERLGDVAGADARISAARWLNETDALLMDVDLAKAEAYARRALTLLPRRTREAAGPDAVPWPAVIRVEIGDNLGYILELRERFPESAKVYDTAIRHLLSFPGGAAGSKYAELLNDRALLLLDTGRYDRGVVEFSAAADLARKRSQGPEVLYNIDNNVARTEHLTWRLRSAYRRLNDGLHWLLDRSPAQSTNVVIAQCNLGLVTYDLGATDEGFALVHGSWQTLRDRLGPEDRETLVRRLALAELQLARGDRRAAHQGVLLDLAACQAESGPESAWATVHRLRAAWLTGLAAQPPETVHGLAAAVERLFGADTAHAAMARDALAAWRLADPATAGPDDVGSAAKAVRYSTRALGPGHPLTQLSGARLALLRRDTARRPRPLRTGAGRVLLTTLDSLTRPGAGGFAEDLRQHGQPPVDPARPGWEADRLRHLLADDVVEPSAGEELCWRANIGRLAALAGAADAGVLLREAADSSAALYGPDHPWTLARAAAAAIADDDPETLRTVVTAPIWR
ncbi:P-loop NTPase family protein [Actinoplanes siamensis]|uniref:hypothetical protein n=1 Tax=Actinoplanes siamensis TaxID=1223317 RepID=UPI001944C5AE|nr:hypothetical protein [Actinoplanes siamensis]